MRRSPSKKNRARPAKSSSLNRPEQILRGACPERSRRAQDDKGSKIDSCRDSERPGLVGQVADAGAGAALLVHRQEGPLVGQVVTVERQVPLVVAYRPGLL